MTNLKRPKLLQNRLTILLRDAFRYLYSECVSIYFSTARGVR